MKSITGYGKTIAFVLTVMLPAPSLAAGGAGAGLGHQVAVVATAPFLSSPARLQSCSMASQLSGRRA